MKINVEAYQLGESHLPLWGRERELSLGLRLEHSIKHSTDESTARQIPMTHITRPTPED
jgi:hypothetical protein